METFKQIKISILSEDNNSIPQDERVATKRKQKKIRKSQKSSLGLETGWKIKIPFPRWENNTHENKTKQSKAPTVEQGDKNTSSPRTREQPYKNKKSKEPNNQMI